MTVARTCKRGAPALTRKETTYSLKASAVRACTSPSEKSFFFSFPLSLHPAPRLPSSARLDVVLASGRADPRGLAR